MKAAAHNPMAENHFRSMFFRLFLSVVEALQDQRSEIFLWSPVCLALGIGAYFSLLSEPPLFLGIGLFFFSASLCIALRTQSGAYYAAVIFCLICAGFLAASLRTYTVYTPVLTRDVGPTEIAGKVEKIEKLEGNDGTRVTLGDLVVEDLTPDQTPRKVRLRVRKDDTLAVGARIRVLGKLHAPSAPVMPGGFDFRRYLYFHGIGAVGFTFNEPEVIEPAPAIWDSLEAWRDTVTSRIYKAMEPREAGVAVALITGQRTGILEDDAKAMRESGLAHMLAISGLHIGLFSGLVFFAARAFMALIPGFGLKHPIKKYAAVLALCAGFFYLALSGFSISAQRAMIMAGIVFLAIIVDRMALTLRLNATAAVVVLVIAPESLLSASFHMSFGAVVALIVFFNAIRPWWSDQYSRAGWFRRMALYFVGVSLTTLIASLATTPFALFHFQQAANYSLPANFFAVPVLGFFIMPLAVFTLALMPAGLEEWPLALMQIVIRGVLEIAEYFSSLPYAVLRVHAMPLSAIIMFVLGMLWLFLWKGAGRWLGLVFLALAFFISASAKMPDALVSAEGHLWAITDSKSRIFVSARNKDGFALKTWEAAYAMEEGAAQRWPSEGRLDALGFERSLICGEKGCRFEVYDRRIAFLNAADTASQDCRWADVIISSEPLPPGLCRDTDTIKVDFFDSRRRGAMALWLDQDAMRMEFVADKTGKRPWSLYK